MDLTILQGSTFNYALRWESLPIVYRPITAITNGAPATITAALHGIPDGWRAAVVSAGGMSQINAKNAPLRDSDYHAATVIDPNTVAFNDTNAAGFTPYTSGGYLQFNTPVDLTGYTARMSIRNIVGGAELLRLTTENGFIALDIVQATINLTLDAVTTDIQTWTQAVYSLEMISPVGVITTLISGAVTLTQEVTIV